MGSRYFFQKIVFAAAVCGACTACHSGSKQADIVKDAGRLNEKIADHIREKTWPGGEQGPSPAGQAKYPAALARPEIVTYFYQKESFSPVWSDTGRFLPVADSMLTAIRYSDTEGLDPERYHYGTLQAIRRQLSTDSIAKYDAVKWATADVLLTDAFVNMANHLYYGLLPPDSISLKKDSSFRDTVAYALLAGTLKRNAVRQVFDSLQPRIPQYRLLCRALKDYTKRYAGRQWGTLPLRYSDTLQFNRLLEERLLAGGWIDSSGLEERTNVVQAIKDFQRSHALYPDGVAGARTIRALNVPKAYRLRQIALNLERWRHFADSLPSRYVWVNIPSFTLTVWNNDTAILKSRVITGKPDHATPLLNSAITNFQLYPYWRVPRSIIAREMLPAIRKDTGYLRKHNLEVVDRHNNVVPPESLRWDKYSEDYFPYVIRQMTGLDNSLGIIKFNFKNKYSVYLHDTNLRSLFNLSYRDLSHGCVRVQRWDSLARFLIRDDTLRHTPDSVKAWLSLQQQKWVSLKTRTPLYIRYFTCEGDSKGDLVFYEDVYGYDSLMMQKLYY